MPVQKDELLAKIGQISELARHTRDELPSRLAKERLDLIIALVAYLTTGIGMKSGSGGHYSGR